MAGSSDEEEEYSSSEDEATMIRTRSGRRDLRVGRSRFADRSSSSVGSRVMVTGSSFVIPSPQNTGHIAIAGASGDSISHVPRKRWDMHSFWDIYLDYEAASAVVNPFGGFVDCVDMFDATLFAQSRAEVGS